MTIFLKADYSAVGDGVADDTAALLAFWNDLCSQGGHGHMEAGKFPTTQQLHFSGAKPFRLTGDGMWLSTIVRNADFGSVIDLVNSSYAILENFGVLANATAFPTNARHGVAVGNSSYVTVEKVFVNEAGMTQILLRADDPHVHHGCVVRHCVVNGKGVGRNGILLAQLDSSGIENNRIINCYGGTPGYGAQIKNDTRESWIRNNWSAWNSYNYALGSDTPGLCVTKCQITDNVSKAPVSGHSAWGCASGNQIDNLFQT